MKRRDFIKTGSVVGAGVVAAPYILKSSPKFDFKPINKLLNSNDNIFIIVEMFGGNDGLNTIVPIAEIDKYEELRKDLHIPEEETVRFEQSDLYMNKALVDNIHNGGLIQLMAEGKLGVVQGIGYENPTLSHFRSRDIWQSGIISTDPTEKLLTGWIGRYFENILPDYPEIIPEHPLAIHIGGSMPLAFKSNSGHMGITLSDVNKFYELGNGLTPTDNKFSPADNNFKEEFNFVHTIASQSETYSKAVKEAYEIGKNKIKVEYSNGLAEQFKMISTLIAGGLDTKVYYVRLSNFDSHAQQLKPGQYTGAHYQLLSEVASGISEFLDDAQKQGFHDRIAGMTVSEFGRRAYQNGSFGTDHGAASVQFLFAGSDANINGGFYNNNGQPVFSNLNADMNIDYTYDFRRTYADALELWLEAEPDITQNVFGESITRLEVLRKRHTSVQNDLVHNNGSLINIYPNPNFGFGNIKFTLLKNAEVKLSIHSITGKKIFNIHSGRLYKGNHNFKFNGLNSGNFVIVLNINVNTYSDKIMVIK